MRKIISNKEYIREIINSRKQERINENTIKLKEEKDKKNEDEKKSEFYENLNKTASIPSKYNEFVTSVKEEFLGECIYSIFNESLTVFDRLDKRQDLVKESLVQNFIKEQGVNKLLNKFRKQNALLSEYALIVDKAVNEVLESVDRFNINSWTVDTDIKDRFIDNLNNCNSKEAIITITDRVADAETEFLNDNTRRQMEIDDILQAKKEKLDSIESKPDEVKESVAMSYDRKIKMIKNRHISSIYQVMAENMVKNILQDKDLQNIYINEGNLNMDSVLIDTGILYTFLETLYTTEMVDNKYIEEFVNNI